MGWVRDYNDNMLTLALLITPAQSITHQNHQLHFATSQYDHPKAPCYLRPPEVTAYNSITLTMQLVENFGMISAKRLKLIRILSVTDFQSTLTRRKFIPKRKMLNKNCCWQKLIV